MADLLTAFRLITNLLNEHFSTLADCKVLMPELEISLYLTQTVFTYLLLHNLITSFLLYSPVKAFLKFKFHLDIELKDIFYKIKLKLILKIRYKIIIFISYNTLLRSFRSLRSERSIRS